MLRHARILLDLFRSFCDRYGILTLENCSLTNFPALCHSLKVCDRGFLAPSCQLRQSFNSLSHLFRVSLCGYGRYCAFLVIIRVLDLWWILKSRLRKSKLFLFLDVLLGVGSYLCTGSRADMHLYALPVLAVKMDGFIEPLLFDVGPAARWYVFLKVILQNWHRFWNLVPRVLFRLALS